MVGWVFSIKCWIGAAFVVAVATFATMGVIQWRKSLDDFKFGSDFSYTAKHVKDRVEKNKDKAAIAFMPVLIPLDFLFLISFSAGVALCSIAYGNAAGMPPGGILLLLVLPAIYCASDFTENIFIARMLKAPDTIDDGIVRLTRAFTIVKLAAATASLMQAGLVLWLWKHLPAPSAP